jgi:hypothetical protein
MNPIQSKIDNEAAVKWSHNMTTKGLRQIQMQENAVRKQVQLAFITVEHIGGKQNLADLFKKEEEGNNHFMACRKLLLTAMLLPYTKLINPKDQLPYTDYTNGHINNTNQLTVHAHNNLVYSGSSIIRDVADVPQHASCLSVTCQARGMLSYVHRTGGQTPL